MLKQIMTGLHFQQLYIDPVSGYAFHSKKDVQRYLKTGDIAKCAIKPSRRQYQDEDNSTVRHFLHEYYLIIAAFIERLTNLQWVFYHAPSDP